MDASLLAGCNWQGLPSVAFQLTALVGLALVVALTAAFALSVLFRWVECADLDDEGHPRWEVESSERRWREDLPRPGRSTDA